MTLNRYLVIRHLMYQENFVSRPYNLGRLNEGSRICSFVVEKWFDLSWIFKYGYACVGNNFYFLYKKKYD